MTLEEIVERVHETGEAHQVLADHRGRSGLCSAFIKRVLSFYAHDAGQADRLARHWRAFRIYGDDPALAYRAKGIHDKLAGRWLSSARAFQRAGELAAGPIDRYSYGVGAIDGLARAGRVDEALRFGTYVADGLDQLKRPDLAARARLNMGNALLWAERGPEARHFYHLAVPALRQGGFISEEASAHLGLSTTHLYGGDPVLAREEAEEASRIARAEEMEYLDHLCQINLAHLALLEGRADEAYATLLKLRNEFEESPSDLARAHEFVGDACLRLNLFTEAADSYRAALSLRNALSKTDRAHVYLGLGEAEPDSREAERHFVNAEKLYSEIGNLPWKAAAVAARIVLNPARPNAIKLTDQALLDAKSSPYHRTLVHIARAEALLARGEELNADLNSASRIVQRFGYRRFAWKIHFLRASSSAKPLPHFRKMFEEILRDRLATTSVVGRTGFLKDKAGAIGAYLACLLETPNRPSRIEEAKEAIRVTRSATLFDEIFRSGSSSLDSIRLARLEALRSTLLRETATEPTQDSRSAANIVPPTRDWTEANHVLDELGGAGPPGIAHDCVVFTEAQGNLWAIHDDRAQRLPMCVEELKTALKWLRFELLAPIAYKEASSDAAVELLEDLKNALAGPWTKASGGPARLCPDGLLWQVPWDALLGECTPLSLHPSFAGAAVLGDVSRVAIWLDEATDLPMAPLESAIVRNRFPTATVLRTRREVIDSLECEWDLIHVICHARHNSENPMFSAFEFSDGPLFASELARSKLRTQLACLSACETGAVSTANRTEPDGLVRAFLARGSHAVIASLWQLDDEAASKFFQSLYNSFESGQDLRSLVSEARQRVREWRSHPFFWAPIALFSGYQQ